MVALLTSADVCRERRDCCIASLQRGRPAAPLYMYNAPQTCFVQVRGIFCFFKYVYAVEWINAMCCRLVVVFAIANCQLTHWFTECVLFPQSL